MSENSHFCFNKKVSNGLINSIFIIIKHFILVKEIEI